jgi:hypothetical protein
MNNWAGPSKQKQGVNPLSLWVDVRFELRPPFVGSAGRHNQGRDSPEYQGHFPVDLLCLPFHRETPFFAKVLSCEILPGSPPLRFGLLVPAYIEKLT